MQNFCISIIYKMVKKYLKKKAPKRRRLQKGTNNKGAYPTFTKVATDMFKKHAPEAIRIMGKSTKQAKRRAQRNFNNRVAQADSITNAPAFKIGVPRKISFEEKVSRVTHPPVVVKRNFQWSAECSSGRKAFFQIPINSMSSGPEGLLYFDAITGYNGLTTNTASIDPTLITSGIINNQQKIYVDYLSEKLQMVNSGSNPIKGKLTLYGYKRDSNFQYGNSTALITPINMMMYASTSSLVQLNVGQEQSVGNGWAFDAVSGASLGLNWGQNYIMPGSTLNPVSAFCAQTDLQLDVLNTHISDFTGYFFTKVRELDFNLKPGQQLDHYTIMNDLPILSRQSTADTYIKGISFYLVVSFQAGIVGDSTVTTGDNVISTGSAQLSCICEEKRILGTHGKMKAQVVMRTPPLSQIAKATQYTINPDTGVADVGYDDDA